MTTHELAEMLTKVLEPVASAHGFELVAVEQTGGRGTPVLRVLLDREGGLDIDAVCEANSWVSEALDGMESFDGPYTLEVSSAGVDRPLRRLTDFDRFSGETVALKLRSETGGRHKWTGTILGTEGSSVLLETDTERVVIPFSDIVKARLKGVVDFNRERGAE